MAATGRNQELIGYFRQHATNGVFDTYTAEDAEGIHRLLDDVHFPRNEAIRVLDCGCGTGRSTVLIGERLGEGSGVVGVDLTPEMIEKAKEIRPEKTGGFIEFRTEDCQGLKFDDETFDWVIVLESFPHFHDKTKALEEFFRVLKDGGCIAILNRSSSEEINRFHAKIGGAVAGDRQPDANTLLEMIGGAGFRVHVLMDNERGLRMMAGK